MFIGNRFLSRDNLLINIISGPIRGLLIDWTTIIDASAIRPEMICDGIVVKPRVVAQRDIVRYFTVSGDKCHKFRPSGDYECPWDVPCWLRISKRHRYLPHPKYFLCAISKKNKSALDSKRNLIQFLVRTIVTDKKIASPCLIMCLRGDEDALSINKYPTLSSSSCGPTHDDCESPNMEVKNELTSSCYFIYSDQKSITNK